MNSIRRIIGAFGGLPALRKHGCITVQKDNRKLDITLIQYGLHGEAICVEQSTENLTDREMHFAVSGEIWFPYYFRIPEQVEVICHSIQMDAFVRACLEEHARVWDMALFREGFDQLTHEQFSLFAGVL